MKIAISVPTGFHARELLIPLKPYIEQDRTIREVLCISPGAAWRQQIFPLYGEKFVFVENPRSLEDHSALLKQHQPDIVVTTTSGLDPHDVPILKAARRIGIPTFTFIASWDNVWKMERTKKRGISQVIADQFVVWNHMMADHLLAIFPDIPANQVAVIGAPRLDFFFHADRIPSKSQLADVLGIPDDGAKLVHISTTELYPMDYVVRTIRQALDANRIPHHVHLLTTVHPGGDLEKHKSLRPYGVTLRYAFGRKDIQPNKDFTYNPTLEDIYLSVALFKHSDLLINHSSTTAIESLLTDVPVINVRYGRPFDWWRWRRSMVYRDFFEHYKDLTGDGATRVVNNRQQLIAAVNEYLDHPEHDADARQRTLKKMITTTDASATRQVYELIKDVASRRGTAL